MSTNDALPFRRGLRSDLRAFVAVWALVALALFAKAKDADSFPSSLVHERWWGQSAPWTTFSVPDRGLVRVEVVVRVSRTLCRDPAGRLLCLGSFIGRTDLIAHVFSQTTGREAQAPWRCSDRRCSQTLTLARGNYALMLHSGPTAEGIASLVTELYSNGTLLRTPVSMSVSDNIMLDVASPSDLFEVHSVLVPDGPTAYDEQTGALRSTPNPGEHGNLDNDWLGVDATEAWLLDDQFRVLDADLAMSGVGAAAMLRAPRVSVIGATGSPESLGRYVLVRPYTRPPFAVAGPDSQVPFLIDDHEYPRPPGAGRMRVLLNPKTDFDGDRVGDALEGQLGTCTGQYPFTSGNDDATVGPLRRHPCMLESAVRGVLSSQAFGLGLGLRTLRADPRDTDGDGISDGAEILGADEFTRWSHNGEVVDQAVERITNAAQTLPLWGFDPRHKDVLIELDRWSSGGAGVCAAPANDCPSDGAVYPVQTLTTEAAFDGLWQIRRNYAALPSLRANNPDGRAGVEFHFDVRFAAESSAHGTVAQVVPRHLQNGVRTPFGKAGLVTFVANTGGSGRCACDPAQMQLDRRHAGIAHWTVGLWNGGGVAGFAGNAAVNIGDFGLIAHELGHVFGLEHGGPTALSSNPFSPSRAVDRALEDKVVFPTLMTYAYDYNTGGAEQSRRAHDRNAFSVGRNLRLPIPRAFSSDGVFRYGYPESHPFAATGRDELLTRTDVISLWSARGTGRQFPLLDCDDMTNRSRCRSVDFNGNGVADRSPLPDAYTSGSAEAGGATVLARLNGFYCADTANGAVVDGSNNCCPYGTTRQVSSGRTVCLAPNGQEAPLASGELHSMFMQAQMAGFVGNGRLYGIFLDDEVSGDDAINPPRRCTGSGCAAFSGRGKVRWQAIDRITGARSPVVNGRCSSNEVDCAACGIDNDLCGDARFRGDVRLDGAPWLVNGYGSFSASVSLDQSSVMVLSANRTGNACQQTPGDDRTWGQCPWGPLRVGIGPTTDFERTGLRSVTIPGAPTSVSSGAVGAWPTITGRATEWIVVMRDERDRVWWSRCSQAGLCTAAQLFANSTALSQIAVVSTSIGGATRLFMVRTNQLRRVVVNELRRVGSTLQFGGDRLLTIPSGEVLTPNIEAALSAASTSDGRLVLSYENGSRMTLTASSQSMLVGAGNLAVGSPVARDWNFSRGAVVRRSTWTNGVLTAPVQTSPGITFAVIFDGRPASESIALINGSRDAEMDATMAQQVRAFAGEYGPGGPFFRFVASVDGRPKGPHFDWDETGTLSFTPCLTIAARNDLGTLGGDLEPRTRELAGTDDAGTPAMQRTLPIVCPSATIWREGVPINNIIPEFVVGPRRLRPGEDVERIAELVTSAGWHGVGAVERASAGNDRSIPPVDRCVVNNENAAWMRVTRTGGPR